MNTKFGLRGTIQPLIAFNGSTESFSIEGFPIEIQEGVLEIGFENANMKEKAREIVDQLLSAFSVRSNKKYSIKLDTSWETNSEGVRNIGIEIGEEIKLSDRVITNKIEKGLTYSVIEKFDSNALVNDIAMVQKCQKDKTLALAIKYFNEEIIDDKKPLYGVYKALEELADRVGGRGSLAALVGEGKKYVENIMETTNTVRHASGGPARALLSEEECQHRAKLLIEAYAKTIS
jgi:hypothetical protein